MTQPKTLARPPLLRQSFPFEGHADQCFASVPETLRRSLLQQDGPWNDMAARLFARLLTPQSGRGRETTWLHKYTRGGGGGRTCGNPSSSPIEEPHEEETVVVQNNDNNSEFRTERCHRGGRSSAGTCRDSTRGRRKDSRPLHPFFAYPTRGEPTRGEHFLAFAVGDGNQFSIQVEKNKT